MSRTRLSKVTITPRGAWDATTEYKRLDAVSNGGASWLAMQDNTGVTPVEGEDWMVLTQNQIDDGVVELDTSWSSKHTVDMLCPEITATGNPVVLEDCVEGYPLDIAASWEIQQEGSGDPHLEGYGKNLLDVSKCTLRSGSSIYYLNAELIDGDVIHIYGVPTNPSSDISWMSFLEVPDSSLSGKGYKVTYFPVGNTKLERIYGLRTADERTIAIGVKMTSDTAVDLKFRVMVSVDTPTEYESYAANIRPFVGRDSVTVSRYGKNLLDLSTFVPYGAAYGLTTSIDGDVIRIKGTATGTSIASDGEREARPFRIFSVYDPMRQMANGTVNWFLVGSAKMPGTIESFYIDYVENQRTAIVITPFLRDGDDVDFSFNLSYSLEPMTEYEPCAVSTATLALPETVYAGSVGNDGKGEKTRGITVIDGTTVKFTIGSSADFWNLPWRTSTGVDASVSLLCSHFDEGISVNPNFEFCFISTANSKIATEIFASIDDLNAYCKEQYDAGTPVTIIYQLKTPTALSTTPAAIPALATNTVITDADTVTVTTRKDPVKTIAKLTDRISALEAAATNISEV